MSVLRLTRMWVRSDYRTRLDELVEALLDDVREAGGALWADAGASIQDAETVMIISEWRSPADAAAFEGGRRWHDFLDSAEPLLVESPGHRGFTSS